MPQLVMQIFFQMEETLEHFNQVVLWDKALLSKSKGHQQPGCLSSNFVCSHGEGELKSNVKISHVVITVDPNIFS